MNGTGISQKRKKHFMVIVIFTSWHGNVTKPFLSFDWKKLRPLTLQVLKIVFLILGR